jgi:hypothetical protein
MTGLELVSAKVSELVIMGGDYPSGHEFNFWGDNPFHTAHVVNTWPGPVIYSGFSMGLNVHSGGRLMREAPSSDPVKAAYVYYTYGTPRSSWDPLTVLYAIDGLGDMFEFGNECGYNRVHPNGSNSWVFDANRTDQHWLKLKVDNATVSARLDQLLLKGASSGSRHTLRQQHLELEL